MPIDNLFSVRDRIVLITGSSRGLGLSLAKGFAEGGATVIINGRDGKRADQARDDIINSGGMAHCEAFDVTNQHEVEKSIEGIEKRIGPIDVLVNNAGIHKRAPLEELSLDNFRQVIDTNLVSAFITAQAVARRMIGRRQGRIINITSINAEMSRPTIANYCAAKGGLKMLTKAMATEWGRFNINVNAIGPGYFHTELTAGLAADPEFDAWVKKETPLGRWGEPDELVGAAIFLASDASSYVNGHTIYVDGGWMACL